MARHFKTVSNDRLVAFGTIDAAIKWVAEQTAKSGESQRIFDERDGTVWTVLPNGIVGDGKAVKTADLPTGRTNYSRRIDGRGREVRRYFTAQVNRQWALVTGATCRSTAKPGKRFIFQNVVTVAGKTWADLKEIERLTDGTTIVGRTHSVPVESLRTVRGFCRI